MAGVDNITFSEGEDELDQIEQYARYTYPSSVYYAPPQVSPQPQYQYIQSERDLTLPLRKHRNVQPMHFESPDEDISIRKYLGGGIGLISLITENLLSHPFVVLRRQCQVHHSSTRYHLVPFTLIPVIVHLHQRQGITTLWKGIGSVLLVRGMTLAIEDVIYKFVGWPKEVNSRISLRQFGQHILLKVVSLAVTVPFYTASLVETVQSDIASEKPGIFDVFREGCARLVSWSSPQKGRMLPIWILVGPHVGFGLAKYMVGLIVRGVTTRLLLRANDRRGAKPRQTAAEDAQIYATLTSLVATEALFYPFETILHRIQLQGTRTIVDNLDTGRSVVPILTSYEGAVDCYRTTLASEGIAGLYKGFGALVLQFAAHVAVVKLGRWVIDRTAEVMSSKPPPRVSEYYNLEQLRQPQTAGNGSTTASRSISGISSLSGSVAEEL